jgi:tetratricopeptide (TPR) repeat protein
MSAVAEPRVDPRQAPSAGLNLIDDENPWLGLDSFSEETRGYFHGREEEIAELARRVQRKVLAVLFGQSGLGKTSILRAGIVPRLRREGFCPVYVRIDYSRDAPAPSEQIKQAIFRATEEQGTWTQAGTAVAGESLWEFLHHRDDVLKDASGRTLTPLLIFDQFEEIFTLGQADDVGRQRAAQFLEDLADLVENRPPRELEARIDADDSLSERFDFARADYRILIALREDYLAHLESVKGQMPSITQNRMRLARMTGAQALAAVTKPGGKLVSQEVAESIVRFIAGGSELPNAEVEPSLLSLICRELNNARIAKGRSEISVDLLAGSKETILAEYYERALVDQPAAVRRFIEDEMLTDSGYRESLAEERVRKAFSAASAAPDALAKLVNRRLLRVEERLDVRRVELTHDVLCKVVIESRDLRHAREEKEAAERELAAQRAREEATHKALVRARQVAAVCAVLALGAVLGAVFGYANMLRARAAEAAAVETRRVAEEARGEAEKLVVYLLEDFQQELEPIGRLDVVAALAKRALDYYAGLPQALRTPATERNRALAQVRHALALRNLGRVEAAEKDAEQALTTLIRLREGGDASETTTLGLAMAHAAKARVLQLQNRPADSLKESARAYALIEPFQLGSNASLAVRRAFGYIAINYGWNLLRNAHFEDSSKVLDAARVALQSIDGLKLEDVNAAALFTEATAWRMESLVPLGRVDEARRDGQEARPVADAILQKVPGHMPALRGRALILSQMGRIEQDALRYQASTDFFAASAKDYEAFLKVDAGNVVARGNLAGVVSAIGFNLEASGRPREGVRQMRQGIELATKAALTSNSAQGLSGQWRHVGRIEAELGNVDAARTALTNVRRYSARAAQDLSPGVTLAFRQSFPFVLETELNLIEGDFAAARKTAGVVVEKLKPAQASTKGEAQVRADFLAYSLYLAAEAADAMKDYEGALALAAESAVFRPQSPPNNVFDEFYDVGSHVQHAKALARTGRVVEARAALAPAIELHRRFPDIRESDFVRANRAGLRLVQALIAPSDSRVLLAEAATLIDSLSPEYRGYARVARLRKEIAAEQAARR